MSAEPHVTLLGIGEDRFTQDQIQVITDAAEHLQAWVVRYQISPETIEFDEAEKIESESPGRVFTLSFEPTFGEGCTYRYGVIPGFLEDEDEFMVSGLTFFESTEYPYTILDFQCEVCSKLSESEKADCLNCDEGELSVDLFWDDSWSVTAEYATS